MTLLPRHTALERRRPAGWVVIGERRDGGSITYAVCGRHPGESSRQLSVAAFAAFAATQPIISLRVDVRGSLPPIAEKEDAP